MEENSTPVKASATDVPEADVVGEEPRLARPPASDVVHRYALVLAWLLVVIIFGLLKPTTFLTSANISSILSTEAVSVVLTLGLIIPLTTADYDLSVAYNLAFAAMIVAVLNVNHHWAIVPAIVVALAASTAVGFVNGAIALLFRIDTLIVTLGTGALLYGLTLWISASTTISGLSTGLVDWVVTKQILGVPIEFYYALVLAAIIWYVFEYTSIGRRLLIVGRGRNVARLSGIPVRRVRWGGLIAAGFVSGVAGVLYCGTTGSADPTSGSTLLLPAFAGAFLGATAIQPGRFNPWGAVIATYFLATGITGLQLLGIQDFVQELFYGGALLVAVALSQIARRGGESVAGPGV